MDVWRRTTRVHADIQELQWRTNNIHTVTTIRIPFIEMINAIIFGLGFVLGMYILTQIEERLWSLFVTYAVTRQIYIK